MQENNSLLLGKVLIVVSPDFNVVFALSLDDSWIVGSLFLESLGVWVVSLIIETRGTSVGKFVGVREFLKFKEEIV